MDIGTAKPTLEDQEEIVHHCIDICDPDEHYSAGLFAREARSLISGLHDRGTVPIMIGGSGLYMSALLDGLFEADNPILHLRRTLIIRLKEEGLVSLYQELRRLDPIAYARISPTDEHRIVRALEIALGTRQIGHSILEWIPRLGLRRHRICSVCGATGKPCTDVWVTASMQWWQRGGCLKPPSCWKWGSPDPVQVSVRLGMRNLPVISRTEPTWRERLRR